MSDHNITLSDVGGVQISLDELKALILFARRGIEDADTQADSGSLSDLEFDDHEIQEGAEFLEFARGVVDRLEEVVKTPTLSVGHQVMR